MVLYPFWASCCMMFRKPPGLGGSAVEAQARRLGGERQEGPAWGLLGRTVGTTPCFVQAAHVPPLATGGVDQLTQVAILHELADHKTPRDFTSGAYITHTHRPHEGVHRFPISRLHVAHHL